MPRAVTMLFGYKKVLDFLLIRAPSIEVAHEHCKVLTEFRKVEAVTLFLVLSECAKMSKLIAHCNLKHARLATANALRKARIIRVGACVFWRLEGLRPPRLMSNNSLLKINYFYLIPIGVEVPIIVPNADDIGGIIRGRLTSAKRAVRVKIRIKILCGAIGQEVLLFLGKWWHKNHKTTALCYLVKYTV